MIQHSTEKPLGWLDELDDSLNVARRLADSRRAPLNLFDVAEELFGWLSDPRRFDPGFHPSALRSILTDLESVVALSGPASRAQLPALNDLAALIKASQEEIAVGNTESRKRIRAQLTDCMEQAKSGAVREAAFDDLVTACRRRQTSAVQIRIRANWVIGLLQHSNADVDRIVSLVKMSLEDSILLANALDRPPLGSPRARIASARAYIGSPPHIARHVVWLFYGPATIVPWRFAIGPVTLYHAATISSMLSERRDLEDLPDELRSGSIGHAFPRALAKENIVAARIDLGERAAGMIVEDARRLADTVILLGQFKSSTTHWRDQGKVLRFADGLSVGEELGHPAGVYDAYSTYQDRVGYALTSLGAKLASNLRIGNNFGADLSDALKWWRESRDASSAARILLDVRLIELISSRVNKNWSAFLTSNLMDEWIRSQFWSELMETVSHLSEAVTDEGEAEFREYQGRVYEPADVGMVNVNYRYALEHITDVENLLDPCSAGARSLRGVIGWAASPQAFAKRRAAFVNEWQRSTARLKRVRDSLTHGGPATSLVVDSVVKLADATSRWALQLAVDAAINDITLDEKIARAGSGRRIATERPQNSKEIAAILLNLPEDVGSPAQHDK